MNRVYRSVWSAARGTFVAVAEIVVFAAGLMGSSVSLALPTGGQVVA
ncbi:MAG: ESPR domain-containing protein, partial [Betaproteobacteria bacterium]|nr:ESPR domain-containing protein [Betaproteobacteria bacterium]